MVTLSQWDEKVWVVLSLLCIAYCIFNGAGGLMMYLLMGTLSILVVAVVGCLVVEGTKEIHAEFKRGYNETEAV